jgi:hypothetical protein
LVPSTPHSISLLCSSGVPLPLAGTIAEGGGRSPPPSATKSNLCVCMCVPSVHPISPQMLVAGITCPAHETKEQWAEGHIYPAKYCGIRTRGRDDVEVPRWRGREGRSAEEVPHGTTAYRNARNGEVPRGALGVQTSVGGSNRVARSFIDGVPRDSTCGHNPKAGFTGGTLFGEDEVPRE